MAGSNVLNTITKAKQNHVTTALCFQLFSLPSLSVSPSMPGLEGKQSPTEVQFWPLLYNAFAIIPFRCYIFHKNKAHFETHLCSGPQG